MTWRELAPAQLEMLRDPLILDVRSPCEHVVEFIPGSTNIPLLSDEERAVVGTIYKQEGELRAKREALRIIVPKINDIVDRIFATRKPGQPVVVHCWRGGLRSETVASFLSVVGIDCFRLTGGYKAWRRLIVQELEALPARFTPIVLHGLTGVGKTELLAQLEQDGYAVLDLEALANHRGSAFGGMALGQQPTQKNFDAAIWRKMKTFQRSYIFLEGESRKIGRLALPQSIVSAIHTGRKVLVTGSLEMRTKRIMSQYAKAFDANVRAEAIAALGNIKVRLGSRRVTEIQQLGDEGRMAEAVQALLLEYYDPLYSHQIACEAPFEFEVCTDDFEKALYELKQWAQQAVSHELHDPAHA